MSGAMAWGTGHRSVLLDDRAEREPVDVVDLPGRQRLARLDDLVAGREDRHARPLVHLDVGHTDGGDGAERLGFSSVAGAAIVWPATRSAPWRPTFWPG